LKKTTSKSSIKGIALNLRQLSENLSLLARDNDDGEKCTEEKKLSIKVHMCEYPSESIGDKVSRN